MKWEKAANYEAMSQIGAEKIFQVIADGAKADRRINIGLATGNTMLRLYEILAAKLNAESVALRQLHTYNLDEYVDCTSGGAVKTDHPLSYRKYMTENLFRRFHPALGFGSENIHFPDPCDPAAFDRELAEAGNIDLQLLGIGFNGHIAFNEPMSEKEITTEAFGNLPSRVIELTPLTIATNRRLTANGSDIVPRQAVTMGMRQILAARKLLLLACFPEQQSVLATIRSSGRITPELPGSYLLGRPDSEIVYCEDTIQL